MGLLGGACDGCRMRDETIADLREQLREATKTSLAVIDAKAYAIRYAADRPKPETRVAEAPPLTPGELRRRRFQTPLTSEEVEAQFAAERDEIQATAGASALNLVERT